MIEALAALGTCLSYEVQRERNLGNSGAAVDLAWYAAGDTWMPLMIFEVESRASSGMANNAMKVLARDVDDFVKPLFLFHIVLNGSENNERVANLRRQWGSHNYRVYTLGLNGELQRLVLDVLRQHRRVSNRLSLEALSALLSRDTWKTVDQLSLFATVKRLNFAANHLGGFARMSLQYPALLPLYLDHLDAIYSSGHMRDGLYGGGVGDYTPGLLELSILIALDRVPDSEGPQKLEQWQLQSGYGLRMIGPHFGLSRDYDAFILGLAPFIYGMAGMLLRASPASYLWLTEDLKSIVSEERRREVSKAYIFPAALWLLHLSASGLELFTSSDHVATLEVAFELARTVINEEGGVPLDTICSPPDCVAVDGEGIDEWLARLEGENFTVPEWRYFNALFTNRDDVGVETLDAVRATIEMLVAESWSAGPTHAFVCELRKRPMQRTAAPIDS